MDREIRFRRLYQQNQSDMLAYFGQSPIIVRSSSILEDNFGNAFAGKYDGGLAVLPWTLTYCVWSGIGLLAANYLWCVENLRSTERGRPAGPS